MNHKPDSGKMDFYTNYENNTHEYLSNDNPFELGKKIFNAPKKQRQQEFLWFLVLAIPFSLCCFDILKAVSLTVSSNIITFMISFIESVMELASIVLGLILSMSVIKRIRVMKEKIYELLDKKHLIFMTVFAFMGVLQITMDNQYIRLVPLAITIVMMIGVFRLYTSFEKKIFIPVMLLTVMMNLFVILPDALTFSHDVSYSADYYFVSPKEIPPKNQLSQYYHDESLTPDMMNMTFMTCGVIESYHELERDIIQYDNDLLTHEFYSESEISEILKNITENLGTNYNEEFFENNNLMIYTLQYPASPTKVDISKIVAKGNRLTFFEDIYYDTIPNGGDFTELCIVFLKIPKSQNIDKTFGIVSETNFIEN